MKWNPSIILLIFAMFIWGSGLTLSKLLLNEIYPFTMTAIEFVIALIFLFPFAIKQGFRPNMLKNRSHLLYGLMGVALFFGLQHMGLKFSSSNHVLLIQSLIPLLVILLFWRLFKVKPHPSIWIGLSVALVGVVLIALFNGTTELSTSWMGNLLVFMGIIAFAFYVLFGKQHMNQHPPVVSHFIGISLGLTFLIPVAIIECMIQGWPLISAKSWFTLLFLGILISGLALWFWQIALMNLTAINASLYLFLIPCFSLFFTYFSGGVVQVTQWIGVFIVCIGLLIGEGKIRLAPK